MNIWAELVKAKLETLGIQTEHMDGSVKISWDNDQSQMSWQCSRKLTPQEWEFLMNPSQEKL